LVFKRDSVKPTQVLVIGFAVVILVGAMLLTLPISSISGQSTDFISSLFTATSAVCVTGLVVVDTGTYWSTFGQTIIILLIQIGGLGFMTIATLIFFISRKKISFKERMVLSEAFNMQNIGGIVKYTRNVIFFTLSVETIGILLLCTKFIPEFGIKKGLGMSIFHGISAFCNAGFDLMGGFKSITPYVNDATINLTIGCLIIIGGLGYSVVDDVFKNKRFNKLSMYSKMVLTISGLLIVFGMISILIFEYNNPNTLRDLPWYGKLLASWFQAVSPRTAGFNSVNLSSLTTASVFLTIVLMFIGGSPGSTAGGIKTTTIGTIFLTVLSVLKGKDQTEVFGRTISFNTIKKALSIVAIATLIVSVGIMILSITENATFIEILFEVVSAFGTVGLTLGLTPDLSLVGRLTIISIMFIGRLGPLTIALAINEMQKTHGNDRYKYPEGNILVG